MVCKLLSIEASNAKGNSRDFLLGMGIFFNIPVCIVLLRTAGLTGNENAVRQTY
ncbi:hypothetical protein OLMES_4476 [Oleiphilus messinensis]|uniref:Uncharacterized protein n=1 Tax=Oleiphilus messinensis TaxID=141451 RepID=A0A1Y0ID40_9GAMM|nr:hypothetical protein OLMES_4476 [Oleiphilus messinensis]